MSKFFKALEEAERDQAFRTGTARGPVRSHQSVPASAGPALLVTVLTEESTQPPRPFAPPEGGDRRLTDADRDSMELQQLWFAILRRRPWSSLVVIPAHAGASAVSTVHRLAAVAERHLRRRVAVINAGEPHSLEELPTLLPGFSEQQSPE